MGYLEDMGWRIKARSKEVGVTSKQLANDIDVSRNTISNIIRGNAVPGIDKLLLIALALDTSLDWLVFGDQGTNRHHVDSGGTIIQSPSYSQTGDIVANINHSISLPVPPGSSPELQSVIKELQGMSGPELKKVLKVIKALK